MTDRTLTLANAETALCNLPSTKTLGNETISLQAALDALRGAAVSAQEKKSYLWPTSSGPGEPYNSSVTALAKRSEVLAAADEVAEITEACLRMMEHVLQGTGKFDMAITPDHRLSTTDGWKRLTTYRQKRGDDHD